MRSKDRVSTPAAPMHGCTRARGANGPAKACRLRLDATDERSVLSSHDLPHLDVGLDVAQGARRKRRLRADDDNRFAHQTFQPEGLFASGDR